MSLAFDPPLPPMLAKVVPKLPKTDTYLFEPKWDGFRAIVYRDGDHVFTQSRDLKGLDRYFPELQEALRNELPPSCIVDGEIIVAQDGKLEFEMLQQRIHPAQSRVDKLARETPTMFVAFDLLALGDRDLRGEPQLARREHLEAALASAKPPVLLTPATQDVELAMEWFQRFEGAGLDGIIAKPSNLSYQPKKRVLFKIKHVRTADCVVAGFRWHKKGPGTHIGSLLLGLYDDEGKLHHVGITSSFKMDVRERLATELAPLREGALEDHPWKHWAEVAETGDPEGQRLPGGISRWSRDKDLSWVPLRLERVVEVKYDFLQGDRFRHATTFLRWRSDKNPQECRYDQLERPEPARLDDLFLPPAE